jgi:hypothetical protein
MLTDIVHTKHWPNPVTLRSFWTLSTVLFVLQMLTLSEWLLLVRWTLRHETFSPKNGVQYVVYCCQFGRNEVEYCCMTCIFPHHLLIALSHSQFHIRLKTSLLHKSNHSQASLSWRFSNHWTRLTISSLTLILFPNVFLFCGSTFSVSKATESKVIISWFTFTGA